MENIGEEGIVTEIKGKIATVRINKAAACAHCKSGCMEQGGFMVTEAENSAGAKVGDTVILKFDSKAALSASFITFGPPLLALLLGAILGHALGVGLGYEKNSQLFSIGGAIILFILSFIPVGIYDRRLKKGGTCNVNIVAVRN